MKCGIWLEYLYDSTLTLWQNEPWHWNGTMACGGLDDVVILNPTSNIIVGTMFSQWDKKRHDHPIYYAS